MTTSIAQQCLPILQEAVASGHPFDLAILDRSMPEVDGIQLGQLIRDEADLAHTKLLLLTSIGQRGEAAAAHQAGFAGYLTKPLHKVQLHDGLATVMGYCWNAEPELTPSFGHSSYNEGNTTTIPGKNSSRRRSCH